MGDLKEALWELANCDQLSTDLNRERTRIPGGIEDAEAKAEAARQVVATERATLEEAEQRRRSKEAELQDTEAARVKFQGQAPMVKTNQEYTALMHEIDHATRRSSEIEEEILLAMEDVDAVAARIQGVEKEQGELEHGFKRKADELRARLQEVGSELETRSRQRDELVGCLPEKYQKQYKRMFQASGAGSAWIKSGNCAACHFRVPPELINRVLRGEVHLCNSCNRILVMGEE